MSPKIDQKSSFKEPTALKISFPEFFAESMRILQRLTNQGNEAILAEFSNDIEYLSFKQCGYEASAILQFDDRISNTPEI